MIVGETGQHKNKPVSDEKTHLTKGKESQYKSENKTLVYIVPP